MTFDGLGEMFEGYSADTRAGKFPLVSMMARAEGLSCADLGARTPIGAIENFQYNMILNFVSFLLLQTQHEVQFISIQSCLLFMRQKV